MTHQKSIVVLGAGMVGVCSALALQKQGLQVTLVDKQEAGRETSFGNAGMITPSSLIPFNNPKLFAALPAFLRNKSLGLRYNPSYVLSELSHFLKFMSFATTRSTKQRMAVLYELIERSTALHQQWSENSGNQPVLRPTGWLKLYRKAASFEKKQYEQAIYQEYGIAIDILSRSALEEFEPALKSIYLHGMHIKDALSVASPGELVTHYLQDFLDLGGEFIAEQVLDIKRLDQGFSLDTASQQLCTEQLVIAAGPWSGALLKKLHLNLPIIFERGGHRQFAATGPTPLKTPLYDVDAGFVASPNSNGVRISCGVELQHQKAKPNPTQLTLVTEQAKQGLYLPDEHVSEWFGARPTLPDSMPIIGESKIKGLWLNTGHQHIGFSTGTGSADILANLMQAKPDKLASAFTAARFGL